VEKDAKAKKAEKEKADREIKELQGTLQKLKNQHTKDQKVQDQIQETEKKIGQMQATLPTLTTNVGKD
jgi:hypothetical protein